MLALTLVGLVVLAVLLVVAFSWLMHTMGFAWFTISGAGSAIGNLLYLVLAAIAEAAASIANCK